MSSITYRPEIDGLRALAVLSVIVFHFAPSLLPSGFMGVDVFFVISGYLITSILIHEKEQGKLTLLDFWSRRVRRIFPALSAMIILVLIITLLSGMTWLCNDAGKQAIAASIGVSNYRMLTLVSNYWSPNSEKLVFLHTWSLGVEEQFYLVYPAVLAVVLSALHLRRLSATLVLLFASSLAWCCYQTETQPARAFFMMPARAWELIAGALVAVNAHHFNRLKSPIRQVVAWAGFLLVITSLLLPKNSAGFPWPMAVAPVFATAAIISCGNSASLPGLLFSAQHIVNLGKASYSLYLWHWPALVLGGLLAAAYELPALRDACLVLGLIAGFISWRWVEPVGRKRCYVRTIAPPTFLVVIGLAFYSAYTQAPFADKQSYHGEGLKEELYDARCQKKLGGQSLGVPVELGNRADVFLLGDSHALAMAAALDAYMHRHSQGGYIFASGGARLVSWNPNRYEMAPDERRSYEQLRQAALIKYQPKLILISCRWETFNTPDGLAAVSDYIKSLFSICPRSKVVILGQPPRLSHGDIKIHEWLNFRKRLGVESTKIPVCSDVIAYQNSNAYFGDLAKHTPNLYYFDTRTVFAVVDGRVEVKSGERLLYDDDDHISTAGAERVLEELFGHNGE